PDPLHHFLRAGGYLIASARHAKARDRVEKTAAERRRLAQAPVGRRWAEQEDCINPPPGQQVAELVGLFDRQVEHQDTIDAGGARTVGEPLRAEAQDRIRVTEYHHWR